MAKKKVVEPPVEQPKESKADLIKQLLKERELACAMYQLMIDRKIMELSEE